MSLDPVTLEILATKVSATAEEMGIALQRSGRTIYVKETQDFGTGLMDLNGKMFCYPRTVGVSNMVDNDAKATIDAVRDLRPGDVIITNDPYRSQGLATHLPDLHVVQPYFHNGQIVCFGWCFIHSADVGGRVPSSISPSNTEVFQEGLMIPPMKVMKEGIYNEDVLGFIEANSRTPEENIGDLKAMIAALAVGERRVSAMIAQHGYEIFVASQVEIVRYTAAKARDAFRTIPDGEYCFCDYLDDDLVSPIPVRINARMTVADGRVHLDFAGTDPQIAAAFNVPTGGKRHSWLSLRLLQYAMTRDPSIPVNSGVFDPITVSVPKGSILNPVFPAAVGVRHAPGGRMIDVLGGLLAQAVPDFIRAAGCGVLIPVVMAEPADHTGRRKVDVVEPVTGGSGASLGLDGVDARDNSAGGMSNNPLESVEGSANLTIVRYGIRPDSGGPGKWRGGVGVELTFEPHRRGSMVLARGLERFRFAPWGLLGGKCGANARAIKNYGRPDEQDLGKIDMVEIAPGETFTVLTPGGGGYGDPLERDPEAVHTDVKRGFVTKEGAAQHYGVIITDVGVDQQATESERAKRVAVSTSDGHNHFELGPERTAWESVFDAEFMERVAEVLGPVPATAKQEVKKSIFAGVLPLIEGGKAIDADALRSARPLVEAAIARARQQFTPPV